MKNRVQLIGNVGQTPEIKTINNNKLANFSLATNEHYFNDKGEKINQTQWHKLVAWGKTAEIIEKYVDKGKEIAVTGKLTHRSYDDNQGIKRYFTEVLVNEVVLFG